MGAMEQTDRLTQVNREKGKTLVRAMHLSEFQAAGAARAVALHEADEQLDRIARALPDALNAGVPLAEIARSSGVSRQTLYELKARYDPAGDIELAVLQSVATRQPTSVAELAQWLNRSSGDINPVVESFVKGGVLAWVSLLGGEDPGDCVALTDVGSDFLGEWWAERYQDGQDA
jgi:DNA-binding phage protein